MKKTKKITQEGAHAMSADKALHRLSAKIMSELQSTFLRNTSG